MLLNEEMYEIRDDNINPGVTYLVYCKFCKQRMMGIMITTKNYRLAKAIRSKPRDTACYDCQVKIRRSYAHN